KTAALEKYPVRSRHPACAWVAIGTVSALSRAHNGADRAGLEIDRPDHMILGVRDVQHAAASGNALGAVQRRAWRAELGRERRAAVSFVAQLSRPGKPP